MCSLTVLTMAYMPPSPSFPGEEHKVLQLWEELDAFQKSQDLHKDMPKFTFYDGPPFATG